LDRLANQLSSADRQLLMRDATLAPDSMRSALDHIVRADTTDTTATPRTVREVAEHFHVGVATIQRLKANGARPTAESSSPTKSEQLSP